MLARCAWPLRRTAVFLDASQTAAAARLLPQRCRWRLADQPQSGDAKGPRCDVVDGRAAAEIGQPRTMRGCPAVDIRHSTPPQSPSRPTDAMSRPFPFKMQPSLHPSALCLTTVSGRSVPLGIISRQYLTPNCSAAAGVHASPPRLFLASLATQLAAKQRRTCHYSRCRTRRSGRLKLPPSHQSR